MWDGLMRLSGEERIEMGASMFAAAREMMAASFPDNLTKAERKRALYERTYGESMSEACWEWLKRVESATQPC